MNKLNLSNYEEIKSNLIIKPVNVYEATGYVYKTVGDIALVLYYRFGYMSDDSLVTAKVPYEVFNSWKLDLDAVIDAAMQNTHKSSCPVIMDIFKFIMDPSYVGEEFMKNNNFSISEEIRGVCLTTTEKINGAVAIFLPGVKERLHDLIGEDYYLCFTSKHEVMLHPVSLADYISLREVVGGTIDDAVEEEDFLTREVYICNGKTIEKVKE